VVDNNAIAPATTDLTLRIGFVLLSRAAKRNAAALLKPTGGRSHQNLKRRLTLILNRDF
jgi:hypothetical protein